jgi:ABC-type polar amino acid transport system ATPase subunit
VADARTPVVQFENVTKDYRGLRPLRVASLVVHEGERVAIAGFDRITAEIFVNMINGAILPDSGDVRVFGAPTSAIVDSDEVRQRVVDMARAVEIDEALLDRPAVQAELPVRLRIHLGRALAIEPQVLLMEHPTASLDRAEVPAFARIIRTAVESRGITVIALTEDTEFAEVVADTALKLHAGSGALTSSRGWRRFFGG